MAAPRTYTDAQRTDALVRLAANGGNKRLTARETGIPETTLRQWANGDRQPESRPASAQKMRPAAEDCERIASAILRQIEQKHDTATLVGSATVFGILLDKAAMLRATADTYDGDDDPDLSFLNPDELAAIDAIVQRAKARQGAGTDADGELHAVDVASVPVGLASPGIVQLPGPPRDGEDQTTDGVHATEAREIGVIESETAGVLPGQKPGQGSDTNELRGGTG